MEIVSNKTNTMVEHKWYMIRCATSKEEEAIKNFEFELENENLSKYVSEFYIPKEKITYLQNNKKTRRSKLMFPGYVMAKMNPNAEVIKVAKRTNYIVEISGYNGVPSPISNEEYNRIFKNVEESAKEVYYAKGSSVVITDGPFSDFTGVIEEVNTDKQKLKVTVNIFGRATLVDLGFSQVDIK